MSKPTVPSQEQLLRTPPQEADIATSIPARFRQIVRTYAGQPAVVSETGSLTYAELDLVSDRIAARIAAQLLTAEEKREEAVALVMRQSIDLVAATLGVLKAGKIVLALPPRNPEQRLKKLMTKAGCRLVISDGQASPTWMESLPPHIRMMDVNEARRAGPAFDPPPIDARQTAVLLPTSGSTGEPKLVMRNHASTVHSALSDVHGCAIKPDDRFGMVAFAGYGAGCSALFNNLLVGSTLVLVEAIDRSPQEIVAQMRSGGVTVTMMAAPLLKELLRVVRTPADLPALRRVRSAGQTLYPAVARSFYSKLGATCRLVNGLASSELAGVSYWEIPGDFDLTEDAIPVGYAAPGKEILIVDDNHNPLPQGEIGRIAVRSRFVSQGYWGDSELTNASFLPDPQGGDERLFLTGDLGRLREDGNLELHGRGGQWAKIQGHKVQPAEVEKALLNVAGVQSAVVVVGKNHKDDDELIAYLVSSQKDSAGIRASLLNQLPAHFLPSRFRFLPRMPLLANGKIDLQALRDLSDGAVDEFAVNELPRAGTEEVLASIWSDVLDCEVLGRDDDFLALGGNSLTALRILHMIDEIFGVKLKTRTLFEQGTIAELAAIIESKTL